MASMDPRTWNEKFRAAAYYMVGRGRKRWGIRWNYGVLVVSTKHEHMHFYAPVIARLMVWKCRLLHRRRYKGYDLPSAGRYLYFPIRCNKCGCHYELKRRNTPQWGGSPWRKKRDQPKTWDEWHEKEKIS